MSRHFLNGFSIGRKLSSHLLSQRLFELLDRLLDGSIVVIVRVITVHQRVNFSPRMHDRRVISIAKLMANFLEACSGQLPIQPDGNSTSHHRGLFS